MSLVKEIRENRWGIILGGVWGIIDAMSLLSSFIFKKDLILFFLNPIPYFILYFPMTVFNFFWILFTWNDAPVSHIFKEEFIDLNILEIAMIGSLLLLTGCFVGYLFNRLVKFLKSGRISLWKEIKENKLGCILGALWGGPIIISIIFDIYLFWEIPFFSDILIGRLLIFLPIVIYEFYFLTAYGTNPFNYFNQNKIPLGMVSVHGDFLLEYLIYPPIIGIFLGYLISKSVKRLLRMRK